MGLKRTINAPRQERQIKNPNRVFKDTSKWYSDILQIGHNREFCVMLMATLAVAPCFVPGWFDLCRLAVLMIAAFYYVLNRKLTLPIRVPGFSKKKRDYGTIKPGRKAYSKPEGIMFVGNADNGREIWLRADDMKTHMLVFGTTGSGKTVTLQAISYNTYCLDTGLVYIDPKGSPNLVHELFTLARRVAREDDFLVLDFMTGGKKSETSPMRISNTTNPFAKAPADTITNLLSSLLPKEEGSNSVFQQKALAILMALIPILVSLRDKKKSLPLTDMTSIPTIGWPKGKFGTGMSIALIRDYLEAAPLVAIGWPMKNEKAQARTGTPSNIVRGGNDVSKEINDNSEECDAIAQYVDAATLDVYKAAITAINYAPGIPFKDQKSYFEQLGYAKGYFGTPLASLSGMYGHLFNVSSGEVDMSDTLFNRRILVAVLPSMEKSPSECENLGKIILASIKQAVAGGLGFRIEGRTIDVLETLPSSSNVPSIIIVDEYAAIMMPGFEIVLTQARSLGFMAVIASQDYAGLKGKDAKSCDQIMENTAVKIFMKIASAKETWDFIRSLYGRVTVEEVAPSAKEYSSPHVTHTDRVHLNDLMQQIEGEFHAFYGGSLIRGSTRYFVPPREGAHVFRVNRFVRTDTSPETVKLNLEAADAGKQKPAELREKDLAWKEGIKRDLYYKYLFRLDPVFSEEDGRNEAA